MHSASIILNRVSSFWLKSSGEYRMCDYLLKDFSGFFILSEKEIAYTPLSLQVIVVRESLYHVLPG